jgi:hypothetical protein
MNHNKTKFFVTLAILAPLGLACAAEDDNEVAEVASDQTARKTCIKHEVLSTAYSGDCVMCSPFGKTLGWKNASCETYCNSWVLNPSTCKVYGECLDGGVHPWLCPG